MSPVEALHHVISHMAFFSDSKTRWPRPGQVVERQSPEIREALSRLTSHEACKARNIYITSLAEQRWNNGLASRLKQAFDRKRPNYS